jgi:hypothetical protein
MHRKYLFHLRNGGQPRWSSGQSSWLHIQSSGFDSRRYQIFWEVVGLERGPLSLMSTTEELLGRKRNGSGLKNQKCGRRNPLYWPRNTLYQQTLAVTSPTRGCRTIGIVRGYNWVTLFLGEIYTGTWPSWLAGGLKKETINYAHESRGTQIWERLRWRFLAKTAKYRLVFSSERANHINPKL